MAKLTELLLSLLLFSGLAFGMEESNDVQLLDACRRGNVQAVCMLIKEGAHIDTQDRTGKTPLHVAAELGFEAVVDLLIKARAQVNVRDTDGCTPLYYAAWRGNIKCVEILIKAGANIHKKKRRGARLWR